MDNVVDIIALRDERQPDKTARVGHVSVMEERFLIDEGLNLLAAYRAIHDSGVRQAVRALVGVLAKAGEASSG